jgi:hypothetical protein
VYETYAEGQTNSHDEAACTFCTNRLVASQYNSNFAEVGVGIDDDEEYDGGIDDEECNGVRDIIVSGLVSLSRQPCLHFYL